MADKTSNFEKHASKNPLQKLLIGNFYNTLILLSKNLKAKTILDAGCGEGFTLQKFYEAKIGEYLEGIEYSESAIEIGKKIHPLLKIKKGDIYKLPYEDNFFDLIICSEVLEHLDDPKKALNELKRVSKKYLLLSVPNEPLFTIQRFLRGKNILKLGAHPEHIQSWSSGEFENLVRGENLKIISKKTPFPWTVILAEKI